MKYCIIKDCNKEKRSKIGYCSTHYTRYQKYGDPHKHKPQGTIHGLTDVKGYRSWCSIRQRCNNKKLKAYKNYGGRGIKLCDEWQDPIKFIEFIKNLPHYNEKGYTLDRIDNNGDYEPSNMRFANHQVQTLNQRINPRNTTGYRGITNYRGKYKATIRVNGILYYIGNFEDKKEAAYIRDQFTLQMIKESVPLNVL